MTNPSKPRAFLVQEMPDLNYLPVKEYASWPPVVIFKHRAGQITLHPDEAMATARERLAGFTEDDFIVLSGDPVAISIAVLVASQLAKSVALLRWDRREMQYVPITIKTNL